MYRAGIGASHAVKRSEPGDRFAGLSSSHWSRELKEKPCPRVSQGGAANRTVPMTRYHACHRHPIRQESYRVRPPVADGVVTRSLVPPAPAVCGTTGFGPEHPSPLLRDVVWSPALAAPVLFLLSKPFHQFLADQVSYLMAASIRPRANPRLTNQQWPRSNLPRTSAPP